MNFLWVHHRYFSTHNKIYHVCTGKNVIFFVIYLPEEVYNMCWFCRSVQILFMLITMKLFIYKERKRKWLAWFYFTFKNYGGKYHAFFLFSPVCRISSFSFLSIRLMHTHVITVVREILWSAMSQIDRYVVF
jgi:hypothetical protein